MILEFLIASAIAIASIISPEEAVPESRYGEIDEYINHQLRMHNDGHSQIVFKANVPRAYHQHIINEAYRVGWYVTIDPCPGFNNWEECYLFTFTPRGIEV